MWVRWKYMLNCEISHSYVYIDVTVANICADTYIKQASKKRAVIAQFKEKHKLKKYQDNSNIMGIGLI